MSEESKKIIEQNSRLGGRDNNRIDTVTKYLGESSTFGKESQVAPESTWHIPTMFD